MGEPTAERRAESANRSPPAARPPRSRHRLRPESRSSQRLLGSATRNRRRMLFLRAVVASLVVIRPAATCSPAACPSPTTRARRACAPSNRTASSAGAAAGTSAWDTQRLDWLHLPRPPDRPATPTNLRFPPRDPPDGDVAAYVTRNVGWPTWRYRASVRLHAPADVVAAKLPFTLGPVQSLEENMCLLNAGSDNPHMLAVHLGMLDVDFGITDPPELVSAFRELADRYQSATRSST